MKTHFLKIENLIVLKNFILFGLHVISVMISETNCTKFKFEDTDILNFDVAEMGKDFSSLENQKYIYNSTKLNPALQQIGLNILLEYFIAIKTTTNCPIVSVGSGNGHVEKYIEKFLDRVEIICVDPVSEKDLYLLNMGAGLSESEVKNPQFVCVEELLLLRPELVSNSTTFLNWSEPNDSTYDYESVKALDSENVLVVFESTGSGGGKIMQQWLNYCGVTTDQIATPEEIELYKFPKYFVVKSTFSRIEKPPLGQFEYMIVWLSKTVKNMDLSKIPSCVGKEIPRRSYDPVESILDTIMHSLSGLSRKIGMGDYFQRMADDINESRNKSEIQKKEKLKFGGFLSPLEPLEQYEIDNLKETVLNLKVGEVLECHHPYYRKLLKEYATEHGITLISHVDNCLKKHDDSMLLYHNECKKCTPVAKVRWHPDYSLIFPGEIYQMQATCDHCDGTILTNYKNRNNSGFGYKYTRGKNSLKRV